MNRDQMPMGARAHLAPLIRADLRRMWWRLLAATGSVLALASLVTAVGGGDSGFVAGLLIASLFMQPLYVAMQMVKDKVDGTLEFLCSLPVSPRTLAASRVLLCAALGALSGAGAAWLVVARGAPAALGQPVAVVALGAFLLGTALPTALAAVILALSTSLSFETLGALPLLLLVAAMGTVKLLEPLLDPAARLRDMLAQPWGVHAVLATAALILAATVWAAFGFTVRALERFRPEPRAGG